MADSSQAVSARYGARINPGTVNAWYADWQDAEHAVRFDGRSALPVRSLLRNYEAFNDVRLLNERLAPGFSRLLEVGCATGEFHRYLRRKHPRLSYTGIDISRPAVERARAKYPAGRFFLSDPALPLGPALEALGLPPRWEAVYSKDVLHHQTDPFVFLRQLLEVATGMLILRTRTRDKGPTVLDAGLSCQYHYQGWMPYIVLNIEELIDEIQRSAPESEVVLWRNRMVLGGAGNRFLPKDCYLPETGTAETAVGVFLRTDRPGQLQVIDREERPIPYPMADRLLLLLRRAARRR